MQTSQQCRENGNKDNTFAKATEESGYVKASHTPSPPKKRPRETMIPIYTKVCIPNRGMIQGVCMNVSMACTTRRIGNVMNSVVFEGRNG
jgi:hypothetical protein